MQNYSYPPLSPCNRKILMGAGGLLLLGLISNFIPALHTLLIFVMGLTYKSLLSFNFLPLFLYPFFCTDPISFLFNGLLFWFVGSELEILWGTKKYLKFLFISTFLGGILFLLIAAALGLPFPLTGMQGLANILCLAYAWHFPERPFSFFMMFPIPAKYFCWIIIALQFYGGLQSPAAVSSWGHLPTMAIALLYLFYIKKYGDKSSFFKLRPKKSKLSLVSKSPKKEETSGNTPKYWN